LQNLTPLFEREGRVYLFGFGMKKRTALSFVASFFLMHLLSKVPPFSWVREIDNIGWFLVYVLIPVIVAQIYSGTHIHGKRPEKYLLAQVRYHLSPKRITPYRGMGENEHIRFETGFTLNGKEEEK